MTAPEPTPSHPVFAALYDRLNRVAEERLLPDHREYLARGLHGTVLDLGAGTGAMFPYFVSELDRDPSIELHAAEPDPHMRRRARQKAHMRRRARQKADDLSLNIDIRSDGAQSLSYADDTFDIVIVALVFCTVPDVETALDEVSRVLKPGGEFRFLEHVHATGRLGRVQDTVNPLWHRLTAGCNLNRETMAVFGADERFESQEITEPDLGLKLVTPFVRGTSLRTHDHPAPSNRQSGQFQ